MLVELSVGETDLWCKQEISGVEAVTWPRSLYDVVCRMRTCSWVKNVHVYPCDTLEAFTAELDEMT